MITYNVYIHHKISSTKNLLVIQLTRWIANVIFELVWKYYQGWNLAHPRESLAWVLSPWFKIKALTNWTKFTKKVYEWIARPSYWIFEAHIQYVSPVSKCLLGIDRYDSNDPIPWSHYWDYKKREYIIPLGRLCWDLGDFIFQTFLYLKQAGKNDIRSPSD